MHCLSTLRAIISDNERPVASIGFGPFEFCFLVTNVQLHIVVGPLALCFRVTNDPLQALSLDRLAFLRVPHDQLNALSFAFNSFGSAS